MLNLLEPKNWKQFSHEQALADIGTEKLTFNRQKPQSRSGLKVGSDRTEKESKKERGKGGERRGVWVAVVRWGRRKRKEEKHKEREWEKGSDREETDGVRMWMPSRTVGKILHKWLELWCNGNQALRHDNAPANSMLKMPVSPLKQYSRCSQPDDPPDLALYNFFLFSKNELESWRLDALTLWMRSSVCLEPTERDFTGCCLTLHKETTLKEMAARFKSGSIFAFYKPILETFWLYLMYCELMFMIYDV